jgi:hypothetical protein
MTQFQLKDVLLERPKSVQIEPPNPSLSEKREERKSQEQESHERSPQKPSKERKPTKT